MHLHKLVSGTLLLMAVACTRVSAQDAELTRIKQNFSRLILPTETDEFHLNATLSPFRTLREGLTKLWWNYSNAILQIPTSSAPS